MSKGDFWKNHVVMCEDISDILDTSMGSIGYWCKDVALNGRKRLGDNIAEHLMSGGGLDFYAEGKSYRLHKDKLLKGIELYETNIHPYEIFDKDGKIDTSMVDSDVADMIIQYALFGDVVYS